MRALLSILLSLWAVTGVAWAQAQAWVQIEARPTLQQAERRAQVWTEGLDNVNGFRLASGWYAIALGPYSAPEAETELAQLRAQRLIPGDSFVSDGGAYRERFWGSETAAVATPPEPLVAGEETVREARASERQLSREARAELQSALRWDGVYRGPIDAAFGPGTRNAMGAWQRANGYEPTGVLTTLQRREVLQRYREALRSIGMAPVRRAEAGIEIDLPLGLVAFDRIEAPFVHYAPTGDAAVRVLLISQPADETSFRALYDVMQSLEIVPLDGPRKLNRRSFEITGANARTWSTTYAELSDGAVKGFTLVWPAGEDRRRDFVLEDMRASFRAVEGVLPRGAVDVAPSVDLLAGLRLRRPERTRSGFFVDAKGSVLTTAAAVEGCGRVTLEDGIEAEAVAMDAGAGLALLRPAADLTPIEVARLAGSAARLQSDVAVSGYSFGGLLGGPTMTFGALTDLRGLDGDDAVERLALDARDGDAGGPVFDSSGAVLGMLLDRPQGDQVLPPGVAFATDASVIARFLSDNGVEARASDPGAQMDPVDLARLGADMTVLVSCWD